MHDMPVVMRIHKTKQTIQLIGVAILVHASLWADFGHTPVTIYDLTQQADAIVVGTVQGTTLQGNVAKIQLQVRQAVKGLLPSVAAAVVDAKLSSAMADHGGFPAAATGRTALWFVKQVNGEWQVLPRAKGEYVRWEEYSFPLPSANPISPAAVLPGLTGKNISADQVVLTAMVSWYQSLTQPDRNDDLNVVDLSRWKRSDARAVIDVLRTSPKRDIRVVGIAAAIRLGIDDALTDLLQQAISLQSSPKFYEVTYSLNNYYSASSESSIAPLQALIAARSNVPGVDLAAGTALQRIRTKAVLPAMALLLDSPDTQAQLRAVNCFVLFAVFGQADGSFPISGPAGPFWTADVQAHQPRSGSSTSELVSFWKAWWQTHKAQLGF